MDGRNSVEEDQCVAKSLLSGDKYQLRIFYRKYYPRLLAYVRQRVRTQEDAEEIVQDTFVGFLDSLPIFSFRSSLWTFLVSIARHEIADYFRKMYAKRAIKYVPFMEQVISAPVYSGQETAELFEQTLTRIKPRDKRILLWKYEQRMPVQEIAERLGVGVKAAESRLFRARQAFRAAYCLVETGEGLG